MIIILIISRDQAVENNMAADHRATAGALLNITPDCDIPPGRGQMFWEYDGKMITTSIKQHVNKLLCEGNIKVCGDPGS